MAGACAAFFLTISGNALAQAALQVDFSGPASYTPGEAIASAYSLTIENTGSDPDADVSIETLFPAEVTVDWSCSATGSGVCAAATGSGNINSAGYGLPVGASVVFSIAANFDSALADDPLVVDAKATTSPPGSVETTDSASSTRNAQSDLQISVTGPASAIAGETATFTISVTNNGPSDADGVTVAHLFSADLSSPVAGAPCAGGLPCDLGTLAAGNSASFDVTLDIDSGATTDQSYEATVSSSAADPVSANDSDSATITIDRESDLAVTNTGPGTAVAGDTATFTIEVTNNGPSDSDAVSVSETLSSALGSSAAGAPCAGGFPCDIGALAAGGSVSFDVTVDVDSGALNDHVYTAAVSTTTVDPVSTNDSVGELIGITREADIEVAKTDGLAVVNLGAGFRYDITVTNNGPSDVGNAPGDVGIVLTDIFPNGTQRDPNVSFCEGAGTAPCSVFCPSDDGIVGTYDPGNCPAGVEVVEYSGDIDPSRVPAPPTLSLAAGSSTTVQVFVKLNNVSNGDIITNTAQVEIAAADDITELQQTTGNSASDQTEVQVSTDIRVEKTDGATAATPGADNTYTVTVFNDGIQGADNVNVTDVLPLFAGSGTAGFESGSIRWQCQAFDNACCNVGGTQCGQAAPTDPIFEDALDQNVDLPGGSRVEFTITGTIHPDSGGVLTNQADAALPPEVIEADPSNNSAVDETSMAPDAQLSITKELIEITPQDGPPFTLTYAIEIGNAGPSFADAVAVSDPLTSALLDPPTAEWQCTVISGAADGTNCPAPGTGPINTSVELSVGGRVRFDLTVSTLPTAEGEVINTATASSVAAGNESVTVSTSLFGNADLQVIATDNLDFAIPGTPHNYTVEVRNIEGDAVFGANVVNEFSPLLENVSWTCEATTPVPGDLAEFTNSGPAGAAGTRLAASADGRHIYQIRPEAASVIAYLRDNVPGTNFGAVGILETEINGLNDGGDAGGVVEGMDAPLDVVLSPDGRHLYVLSTPSGADNALVVFSRSTSPAAGDYGELSFSAAVIEGLPDTPRRVVATLDNIYVSGDAGTIAVYQRNPASGLPEFEELASTGVPADPGPLAVDGGDGLLFVGSTTGNEVVLFDINTDATSGQPIGRLTPVSSVTDAALGQVVDLALVAASDDLYAAASAGSVAVLRYADTDTDSIPDPVIRDSESMTSPVAVSVAPDGEHVLVVGSDGLESFGRDTFDGRLSPDQSLAANTPNAGDNSGLQNPADVAVTSDGRHVLVGSASGASGTQPLAVFSRRAPDPLFAFMEADAEGDPGLQGLRFPTDVVASPDGGHVYAVSLGDNALVAFDRTADAGATADTAGDHLQFLEAHFDGSNGVTGMLDPRFVLVTPDNASVIVSSEAGDSIAVFDRDNDPESPDFGRLTFRAAFFEGGDDGLGNTIAGIAGARGMTMDSTSRHLYVAGGFGASIAVFQRDNDSASMNFGELRFIGSVANGSGAVGLTGVRDLDIAPDGAQVFAVSFEADSLVIFNRIGDPLDPDFGLLELVDRQVSGVGDGPMAVDVSPDGDHVYIAAQNSDSIGVFRRVTDMTSSLFGTVVPVVQHVNLTDGIEFMNGPRDIEVSPDNKRVYVASQFDSAVLVFDRDRNRGGLDFGHLSLVETRRDDVEGVDGLDNSYALAVSPNSRNVYVAGFDDRAIGSFVLGIGSVCSGGGSGDINDPVTIGNRGTLLYRITADLRQDAFGVLSNEASVLLPPRFVDDDLANNVSLDTTTLTPRADLALVKSNDRVSVVAGEPVTYEITVVNRGPSNIGASVGSPVTVSDLFSGNPGFVDGTAAWSCLASSSGALTFVDSVIEEAPVEGEPPPLDLGLAGVADLALVADLDGAGPLPAYLATVGLTDDALTLFPRDPVDGRLVFSTDTNGDLVGAEVFGGLGGARSVAASADGRHVYVASRVDDAVRVFALADDGAGALALTLEQTVQGFDGLDQPSHLALSADGGFLYVAGTNDDAIAVFDRNDVSGALSHVESEREGVNDLGDPGGIVTGLDGVGHVLISADGAHLYAISSTAEAIARFDRDAATGELSFAAVQTGSSLTTQLAGASAATGDAQGRHIYVAASAADRVVVLARENDPLSSAFGTLSLASEAVQGNDGTSGLLAPTDVQLSADGLHLYATGQTSDSITWFIRDPADGSLSFGGVLSNQSSFVDGLSGASALVIDDALDQVYVAGTSQAGLAQFQRLNDSVCEVSGTGDIDESVEIAAGGSVTFEVTVDVDPDSVDELENIAVVTTEPGVDPDASNNQMTDTDIVEVVADLAITKDDGLAEFDGLDGVVALAGTADNVYTAARDDNAIGVFARVDSATEPEYGQLTFSEFVRSGVDGVSGLTDVAGLALSSDQRHLYAVSPVDNALVVFQRDPADGSLQFLEIQQNTVFGVTGLGGATDVALSPDDEHVYVTGGLSNTVAIFGRDADTASPDYGRLTFIGDVQNGSDNVTNLAAPAALSVSPDGRHVYAVSPADQSVVVFARNIGTGSADFGALTFVNSYSQGSPGVAGLAGAIDLAISADGAFVYVLGDDAGTLAVFERDVADNGQLTFIEFKADGTSGTTGLAGASGLRLSPDGAHLYVAGAAQDAVVHFDILADGRLAFASILRNGDPAPATGGTVLGFDGVADVLVSPDGDHVYAGARIDDALSTIERAQDPDPVANTGDLMFSAVLFDGLGGVAPGDVVTYRITVENRGPSDVAQVTVVDEFSDSFSSVAWTCTPSASPAAACTLTGTGSINDEQVMLEAGARITYEAAATVRQDASGTLVNTATVTGIGVQDPDVTNNTATDDDTVLSPAIDLVVDVDNGTAEVTPGAPLSYTVEVTNIGPSFARNAFVSDAIPPSMHQVEWSCAALPVEGLLTLAQQQALPLDRATAVLVAGTGQFAYAAGEIGGVGAVVAYQRDSVTGALSELADYREGNDGVQGIQGAADLAISADQRFLYIAGAQSDSIAVFERDLQTGLLSFVAQYQDGTFGLDDLGGVSRLLLGPDGVFLYAAATIDDAIARFRINAVDGTLSFVDRIGQSDPGVDGLNGVSAMAWSQGHLVAVATDNDSLAAFERNPATGALSFVGIAQNFEFGPPDPAAPLNRPVDVIADGARIMVAASAADAVSIFDFDPERDPLFELDHLIEDGAGGVTGMTEPASLVYQPRQQRLYVASSGGESILLFSLRDADPVLLADYSAANVPALGGLSRIHVPEVGGPLYALSSSGTIGVLARQRGSLCPLKGQRELGVQDVEIAPNGGKLTYTVTGTVFANATGSIAYSVEAGSRAVGRELNAVDNVDTDADALAPVPDLAVTKTDGLDEVVAGTPISYTIGLSNGGPSDAIGAMFTDQPPMYPADPGLVPGSAAWSCSANPPLASAFALDAGSAPEIAGVTALAFDPERRNLLASNPATDSLLIFTVQADGGLVLEASVADGQQLQAGPDGVVEGMFGISAAAQSRDGQHIYAAGRDANSLAVLGRDENGDLEFLGRYTSGEQGVFGLIGPESVVLSPDQRFVYVAAAGSDAITVFSRNEDTGLLAFVERVKDGFGTIVPDSNVIRGVRRLHVTADGENLYAVAAESNAIATFAIDSQSGVLTYVEALSQGDPGIAEFTGPIDLVVAPGDDQLYVAAADSNAINRFERQAVDGSLAFVEAITGVPGMIAPTAIIADDAGTRLYVATEGGAVHVFARDWLTGDLDHRGVLDGAQGVPAGPTTMAYLGDPAGLYLGAPAPGAIVRFDQLALSRCLTAAGTADTVSLDADFGAGGFGEVLYSATVHPSARGDLVNTATLTPALGTDANPANNAGIDTTTVIAVSDIAVVKTGPADAVAGEPVTYQIEVTNAGPSNALGIEVNDEAVPAALLDAGWTCEPSDSSGLSVCPAAGTGLLGFTADVEVGNPLTIELTATVDPAFVGEMINTASLVPEPGADDPDTADQQSAVVTQVRAEPDIRVTKTNNVDELIAGEPVQYEIDVINLGPSDAPTVAVTDTPPPELTEVSWTCTAFDGASCPAAGVDAVAFDADVPAGGRVLVSLSAIVASSATGSLTNSASADVLGAAQDPDVTNNSDSDTDDIVTIADLSVDIADPFDPFDSSGPEDLPYLLTVANAGPSDALDVIATLDASAPIVEVAQAACVDDGSGLITCDFGTLPAGGSVTLDLRLSALPLPVATLDVTATLTSATSDPDIVNNEDVESTQLIAGADVAVSIDNGWTWLSPGQPVEYVIDIRNLGSQAATGVDVFAPMALQLVAPTWVCVAGPGAACTSSGSGDVVDSIDLDPGESVRYTVTSSVDPLAPLVPPTSVDQLVEATLPGDLNPLNNIAFDSDPLRLVIFSDGFESPVAPAPPRALETAQTCAGISLRLSADRPPLAVDPGPLTLLRGISDGGDRLVWLRSLEADGGFWLRLAQIGEIGFEASDWLAWPRASGEIRVDAGRDGVSLLSGDDLLWSSRQAPRAQPAQWERPPMSLARSWFGAWSVEECDER